MQNTNTLYSLQLLRFVASILVLFFHLDLMKSGYKGVDIFFVVSGFVMYYTTFVLKAKNAITFIINRATKIFFLYWLAMLVLYIVVPYEINWYLLKTFFLIPGHASLLGISWSLSYELYFYFLFGTVIYLVPEKFYKHIFLFLFITASTITIINTTPLGIKGTFLNFILGQNLWEFLLGVLCAFLFDKTGNSINLKTKGICALVCLLAVIIINITYLNLFSYIVYGLLSFLLILSATAYEKDTPFNKNMSSLFRLLGDASYAIYLFGPIVTVIILTNNNSSKILVLLVTIISSILINQLIENPFLKISRKFLYKIFSPD